MTFVNYETTPNLGQPVELYEFTQAGTVYRYAASDHDITYLGANWPATAISRSNPQQTGDPVNSGKITVTLPGSAFVLTPFKNLLVSGTTSLRIRRLHLNDPDAENVVFWTGYVSSSRFESNGRIAELECSFITALFNRQMPRRTYQGLCGHVLYDSNCLVDRVTFSYATTVNTIDSTSTLVDLANISSAGPGNGDNTFYQGGFVITDAGEIRYVIEQNVTALPDRIRVPIPFDSLSSSDGVTIFAGCDHTIGTCETKFSNEIRFGGFPYVPELNPFNINVEPRD